MAKIKDIISILENYEKIVKLVGGANSIEIKEFVAILKDYKGLSFDEFKKKFEENKTSASHKMISPKNQSLRLGQVYYQLHREKIVSREEQEQLFIYLALPENKVLTTILNESFEKRFVFIRDLKDTALTVNQLSFLGMALLNIKLKGRNKADHKKNLLDILWTVSENQEMNEIYESAL
ncbi:MAG: hypothetical protein SO274_10170 [Turicibacter bilis]|nr:hypothetical protein [Turicibacter bilis]